MSLDLDTLGLSATVTAEGISAPDYQTVLDTITGYFQQIYGSDAYLDPDSKDGQMVSSGGSGHSRCQQHGHFRLPVIFSVDGAGRCINQ